MADEYIQYAIDVVQRQGETDCSLFNGLSGLALAIHLLSDGRQKFENTLLKIDQFLAQQVNQFYFHTHHPFLNSSLSPPPNFYNLWQGLSGVILYFLQRQSSFFEHLTFRSVELLAQIFLEKRKYGPNWFVFPEYMIPGIGELYENGCFDLRAIMGIAGPLSALSLAKIRRGISTPSQLEAIETIGNWLIAQQSAMLQWQPIISLSGQLEEKPGDLGQESWGFGWPGVLRAIFLAGVAVENISFQKYAIDQYKLLLSQNSGRLLGPAFLTGVAGLLTTTYLMARDSSDPILFQATKTLETELKSSYAPYTKFGFQGSYRDSLANPTFFDDPGIFNGAAGIGLALLLVNNQLEFNFL